jgi:uncharacterized protein (TIGR03066 family)
MRAIVGGLTAVAMLGLAAAGLSADDKGGKVDAKKLVGKWEATKEKEKFTVEFTKDGKTVFSAPGKKDFKLEGTYKLDGNKLTMTMKFGDSEQKMSRTITKLTDTELTSKDDQNGKEDTLKRVKADK